MQLIKQYTDLYEAEEKSELLESRGIATFVSSKQSKQLSGVRTGALRVGLWVILDEQHTDAVELLKNPNHQVSKPLAPTEIDYLRSTLSGNARRHLFRVCACIAAAMVAAALLLLVYSATNSV